MSRISIPTTGRLPSSLRIDPSNPAASKILNRLSRASLLSITLDWLDDDNQALAAPYLLEDDEDEDDFNPPVESLSALRELYTDLQARKGAKREVLDRIMEGDWRHGLSLYQLAMADLQYLYDHPLSQKWTAYRIVPLKPRSPDADDDDEPPVADKESLVIPRFHPSTFLNTLQAQLLPDVKAHYNFDRHRTLPLLLLRIFILDSPYNTTLSLSAATTVATFDTSRTVYIAFPDASPHIFISKPQSAGAAPGQAAGGESKSLRALIVEGIPKAMSRPRQRVALKPTSLSTRNLDEMVERRGAQRTNCAGGGWSIYADEKKKESPLDVMLPTPPMSEEESTGKNKKRNHLVSDEERSAKRRRFVARARFGDSGKLGDGLGVERVDIAIEDPFSVDQEGAGWDGSQEPGQEDEDADLSRRAPRGRRSRADAEPGGEKETDYRGGVGDDGDNTEQWRPRIRLTFHGPHVFAGIRQLVEHGIIDGARMPGWMTGEEGITVGSVRHGRIRGHKGSGA